MAELKGLEVARRLLRLVSWVSTELAGEISVRLFTTPRRIRRPDWEAELASRGQLQALDETINARIFGRADNPAVILIHGWEGRGLQMGLLIEPLLERGYRVIAVDGPAHGESPGRRTNIGHFAQSIQRFIADEVRAGRRVSCVIGHSFGAAVTALAIAAGAPSERAVLVAAPSSLIRVGQHFIDMLQLSPKVVASFRRRLNAWTGLDDERIDLAVSGSRHHVPTLIAHDPADKVVDFANAERFAKSWANARLRPLEGVGHYRILKAPSFIAAVLEFLAEP